MITSDIPVAFRLCERCGEAASGPQCETCLQAEVRAMECARQSLEAGVTSFQCLRVEGPNPKLSSLYAELIEKHFKRMQSEQIEVAERQRVIECGCRECRQVSAAVCEAHAIKQDAAAIASGWGWRGRIRAMWHRLSWSTVAYSAAALAVEWYLLYEFRGFLFACFRMWLGGAE